jgi:hypothetical protein
MTQQAYLISSKTHQCEGACSKHVGQIQRVQVKDPRNQYDWGDFWYCEAAIEEDTERGFAVTT